MRFNHWLQYSWQLDRSSPPLAEHSSYHLRPVTKTDTKEVEEIVSRALILDPDWSNTLTKLRPYIFSQIHKALSVPVPLGTLLLHGSRIIGVSILDPHLDSENHLVSGPCILSEYRSRGLGTHLLAKSLSLLKDLDFPIARGITKDRTYAARFVYPKFEGRPVQFDIDENSLISPV
jgi:hypothetical protein